MKKFISCMAIILSLVMLCSLVGCKKDDKENTINKARDVFETEKEVKVPAKKIKVYTPSSSEQGEALTVARIFQGVINKTQPRVYISDNISAHGVNISKIKDTVVETYGEVEFVVQEMDNIKAHKDFSVFWSLWRDFSNEIENIYCFELNDGLQDSMNVAAMLAGRNKGVAVTRELYEELYSENQLTGKNVVDVCETYGFTFALGSLGINRWISENMVEGSNKELIFMVYPGNRDSGASSHPAIYDMAVAVDGLIYWIDPDFNTYLEVQKNILDQYGSNALVIGWPGINMERAYVNSISLCGKSVVCADWGFANGSIVSGFENYYPTECTSTVPDTETVINNKVYISFTISDGDAWHYATKELLAFWNSPARGAVPITWTIPTLFAKYNPTLLNYLYDTKSPLDEFIQGPSGVVYIYPSKMQDSEYEDFLDKTKSAFEKTKINMVNFWDNNTSLYSKDNERLIKYAQTVKPDAIFLGHELNNSNYFMIDDTVCITEMGIAGARGTHTADEIISCIDTAISKGQTGKPVFVAVNVEAWGEGISTITEAYAKLLERTDADRYEFVSSASLVGKIRSYSKNGANGNYLVGDSAIKTTEIIPFENSEQAVMYSDNESKRNEQTGQRFADKNANWVYKFTFDKPVNFLKMNARLGEQFLVSVSKDGKTWIKACVYGGVRMGERQYLIDVVSLLGATDSLYVKFEDAVKTDGFGCNFFGLKLYYGN